MNPFKSSDPEKRLQLDLDRVSTGRTKLAERLAAAQSAVAEHRMAAQRLARDGADDGALDVTEAQLRSAQDRVATLTAALDEIETQIATLQEALAQLADRKLRAETAAAIERLAEDIVRAGSAFDAGASHLAQVSGHAATIINDAKGLEVFTASVRSEVPAAVQMIARVLRDRARATIAGSAPAELPTQEARMAEVAT